MTDVDQDWSRFVAKRMTNELFALVKKYKLKNDCLSLFPVEAYTTLTRAYYLKLCDKKQYIQILEQWFVIYCVPKKEKPVDEEVYCLE